MVQEECAELISAINKCSRGRVDDEAVIEECVDVELMIDQMRELFKDKADTWARLKNDKFNRLWNLLTEKIAKPEEGKEV